MTHIGCDIESVAEFRKKWKTGNEAFFKRVFSPEEIKYCSKFKDPAERFAARFCAKEAFVKATSPAVKSWVTSVQVVNEKSGAPTMKIWKKDAKLAKFFSTHQIVVSLSHTSEMAMACVLIQAKQSLKRGRRRV